MHVMHVMHVMHLMHLMHVTSAAKTIVLAKTLRGMIGLRGPSGDPFHVLPKCAEMRGRHPGLYKPVDRSKVTLVA